MAYPIPERNRIISKVIKCFAERQKGKVVESRLEIQRRFEYLDWSDQKKIILAFLASGKADRNWIYSHLVRYWDDEFMPIVKDLFEKYHEERCTWAIIRYFPIDYLLHNIDYLSNGHDYFFLCRRMAYDNVPFNIDKQKLSPRDYLTVLIVRNDKIEDEEALDILFSILHEITTNKYSEYDDVNRLHIIEKGRPFLASDFAYIYILTRQLETIGCNEALKRFDEWNSKLYTAIGESQEFKRLNEDSSDYSQKRRDIAKRYIYRLMPEKYKSDSDYTPYASKQEFLEKMIDESPKLGGLVGKLNLIVTNEKKRILL